MYLRKTFVAACLLIAWGWLAKAGDLEIADREKFNEIYWNAQPAAVRVLRTMPGGERINAAQDFAKAGYKIDVMIQAFGYEPWGTMRARKLEGYKWAPALFQNLPFTLVPWPLNPWEVGPDHPMPAGAIKVSLDPVDYPAIDQPPAPDPGIVRTANPVGTNLAGNVYTANFGDNWPIGSRYTDARGSFVKKAVSSPFGNKTWWEKE